MRIRERVAQARQAFDQSYTVIRDRTNSEVVTSNRTRILAGTAWVALFIGTKVISVPFNGLAWLLVAYTATWTWLEIDDTLGKKQILEIALRLVIICVVSFAAAAILQLCAGMPLWIYKAALLAWVMVIAIAVVFRKEIEYKGRDENGDPKDQKVTIPYWSVKVVAIFLLLVTLFSMRGLLPKNEKKVSSPARAAPFYT